VDFPTIQVSASLPGASPETMASAVATPLERQFSTIAGIDSMTSSSALGVSNITIQFTLDRNIDAARQDVQALIAKTPPLLTPHTRPPAAAPQPHPAGVSKVEPRGPADPVHGAFLPHAAPLHGRRVRADVPGPAHLHDQRSRPGHGLRLAEVRGAGAGRSARP